MESIELHIDIVKDNITAIDSIRCHSSLSKNLIKKIMSCGAVWLSRNNSTKRIHRATKKLFVNDQIHLYYNEKIINQIPANCQLISDNNDYSIWNKAAGVFSQGTRYGDHCTMQRYAEKNLLPQRNAFIVHRLDRDANGLIILAHSKKAAALFSALFKNRKIHKTYQVIVEGNVSLANIPYKITSPVDNKNAISIIEKLSYNKETGQTQVQVNIQTGRKHQIRKHMLSLGHPVVGDTLYGQSSQPETNLEDEKVRAKLELTAWKLEFICPITLEAKSYQL
jgi:tRNA pseudouridine32 synthase/23S rRNA pseudouridine746 synthase